MNLRVFYLTRRGISDGYLRADYAHLGDADKTRPPRESTNKTNGKRYA